MGCSKAIKRVHTTILPYVNAELTCRDALATRIDSVIVATLAPVALLLVLLLFSLVPPPFNSRGPRIPSNEKEAVVI